MTEYVQQSIVEFYDAFVRSNGESKLSEIKTAIHDEVVGLLASLDRDLHGEAARLIDATLNPEREKRSRNLKRNIDWLLDGLGEDGAYVDPFLDLAFPTGDPAGIDKTLREWTRDDLSELVVVRYRVAADATTAAAEFDTTTRRLLDRMAVEAAATIGDVSWGVS